MDSSLKRKSTLTSKTKEANTCLLLEHQLVQERVRRHIVRSRATSCQLIETPAMYYDWTLEQRAYV